VALAGALATFAVTTGLAGQYRWIGAAVAVLAAVGVYQVPYDPPPPPPEHAAQAHQPGRPGAAH